MASSPPFVSDAIMELKRKALAFKQAGDIPKAKLFLQQARELEEPRTSQAFQRLAMVYKRNGDIEGAKDALRQSKQLKMEEEAEPEPMEEEEEEEETGASPPSSTPDASPMFSDPVNKAIDEANLEELTEGVSYTIEEMLDVETMVDMQASGMPIPAASEYQQRAVACKKKALLAKESHDMAGAKKHLIQAKQLLAASERLYNKAGQTDEADGDDGEDYSLLDELMGGDEKEAIDDDGFLRELFGAGSTSVELDDLDDLDADMLRDMIEAGMLVPDVEDVLHQSKEKKAMALAFKNEGNMIAAKSALEESKCLERKAAQLSELLKSVENVSASQEKLDPDAMLEAMMRATEEDKGEARKESKETLKASHEYKAQAVELKQANRMDEALVALRLYKQALEVEKKAADTAKRKEMLIILQQEVEVAVEQIRCFRFYERFIDQVYGKEQLKAWNMYLKRIRTAVEEAETGSANPAAIVRASEPNAKRIVEGQDLGFVGSTSTDPRIQVSILEVFDVSANKNYRKYTDNMQHKDEFVLSSDSIRIEGVIQLPRSADLPEDNLEFNVSAVSYRDEMFQFDHSLFVDAERGTSRFAKLLRRRLARRRVTIDVLLVPSRKKGFWQQSQGKTDTVLLGTAIVDLKHLLEKRSVAGDFPLLDVTRRHELGGKVRMAVCTNQPFEENYEPEIAVSGISSSTVALHPYSFITFESP